MRSTKAIARLRTLQALEAERAGEKTAHAARRMGVTRAALVQAKARARENVSGELEYWTKVHKLVSRETQDVSETGD